MRRPPVLGGVPALAALLALAAAPAGVPSGHTPRAASSAVRLPRLVFVSRGIPRGADAGVVPGLGPRGRTLRVGGQLLVRERDGRTHALLVGPAPFDVSDPAVSWDAGRIAFAGVPARDSSWRIYVVAADGAGLRAITHPARGVDDFDPVWLADGRVCFASTRLAGRAEPAAVSVSQLYVVDAAGGAPRRVTSERNGAEEPAIDPRNGRIVYARWWANRFHASNASADGITTDSSQAIESEAVDLWQAVSIAPDGDGVRLAAGDARDRDATMAYQPCVSARGAIAAVRAADRTLLHGRGPFGVQRLASLEPPYADGTRPMAGLGRDAASACAPVWLPDGRLLCSRDAHRDGDYALCLIDARGAPVPVLDRAGSAELDAAVFEPSVAPAATGTALPLPGDALPGDARELMSGAHTFRFDCLNVFANGPLDAPMQDAPPPARGVRIRFFAALGDSSAPGGDRVVRVREAAVDSTGGVHETDLPGDVPMFEQLVGADGRVLMSAHGPAHVAGFNFARAGGGTKCVGCHAGHSAIPVPASYASAGWFNAAPAAVAYVSAAAPGSAGARALCDRRTRGEVDRVAWIADAGAAPDSEPAAVARLAWGTSVEVREVVLYPLQAHAASARDVGPVAGEVVLLENGVPAGRFHVPAGAGGPIHVATSDLRADAVEVRLRRGAGRKRVALAEIETIARLP